ncbi:MAG: hypothetical protein ACOX04_00950 [Candidatus Scatomorpha sp.]|jgi:hypothetical protein
MNNVKKASFNYMLKSKGNIITILTMLVLYILVCVGIYAGVFKTKSEQEMALIMYILILGITLLIANSLVLDLTVKDKLSNRIEFFLAANIKIKDLILAYSEQMLKMASFVPFMVFMTFYYFIDFEYSFMQIVILYMTTVALSYSEVLFLNTYTFYAQKNKLFKNVIIFGTFLIIYLSGMFSKELIALVEQFGLDIIYVIIGFNLILSSVLYLVSRKKIKDLNNELLIKQRGQWE